MAEDIHDAGQPADRVLSGTVPEGAENALLILRINAECDCSAPVNVTLGSARYRDERSGQEVVRRFTASGATETPVGTHISAYTGQKYMSNTVPWPVRPGNAWTMHIAMGAAEVSARSGYVALVFRRGDGREVLRLPLQFSPARQQLGGTTTNSQGRFIFLTGASVPAPNPGFRVEFNGTASYRPSSATTS